MTGPLTGIRVVEAGRFASAPSCATILADWGADVIKLEPLDGDPARGPGSIIGGAGPSVVNPRFDVHNRTRRSIALDLKHPEGQVLARRLIGGADVFVTNIRTAALSRIGLGNALLCRENPRLVYGQVTGYGPGDEEERRSYDHGAFWSYSGMAALFQDGSGRPPQPAGGMGDRATGSVLAGAVSAALFARERTGRGDHVSVSLLRTAFWLMASDVADVLSHPDRVRPTARHTAPIPTVNCYRCSDGRWLWLQVMTPERDWPRLLEALDAQWLDTDPRFRGGDPRLLASSRPDVIEALDEIFRGHTLAEWSERLTAVGLTFAPVQDLATAVRDQVSAPTSGAFREIPRPGGAYTTVGSPAAFEAAGLEPGYPAPGAGADTRAVLGELGLAPDEIDRLQREGVCGSPAGGHTGSAGPPERLPL